MTVPLKSRSHPASADLPTLCRPSHPRPPSQHLPRCDLPTPDLLASTFPVVAWLSSLPPQGTVAFVSLFFNGFTRVYNALRSFSLSTSPRPHWTPLKPHILPKEPPTYLPVFPCVNYCLVRVAYRWYCSGYTTKGSDSFSPSNQSLTASDPRMQCRQAQPCADVQH